MNPDVMYNRDAELAVIGSMIAHSEIIIPAIVDMGCKSDWFYSPDFQQLFLFLVDASMQGKRIDLITVSDQFLDKPHLERLLHECYDISTSSIQRVESYLKIVKDKFYKRQLYALMREHTDEIFTSDTLEEITSKIDFDLQYIIDSSIPKTYKSTDMIKDTLQRRYNESKKLGHVGLPSGWPKMRLKMGGYRRGKPTIVASRPSKGKSTYMTNEMYYHGTKNYRVGCLSLEMEAEELYIKMACHHAGLDSMKYDHGNFSSQELVRFNDAMDYVLSLPIFISDGVKDIRHCINWMTKMVQKQQLDIVYLDYIQRIDLHGEGKKNMTAIVNGWSKQLANKVKALNIAGVWMCQIGRSAEAPSIVKPEDRHKYTPKLSNLKDSGALEEDAYTVVLLYPRPDGSAIDDSELDNVPYVFDVAKNRGGRIGRVNMTFKKALNRFEVKR